MIYEKKKYDDFNIKVNFGDYTLNVLYFRYIPDHAVKKIEYHSHSSFEFHYVSKGLGEVSVDRKAFPLKKGTVFIVGPSIYHMQKSNMNDHMNIFCINFEIIKKHKDADSSHFKDIDIIIDTLNKDLFLIEDSVFECENLFEIILQEFDNQFIGYISNIEFLISQILIYFARHYLKYPHSNLLLKNKSIDDKRRFIIDTYFLNYQSTLTPEELSNKICVSKRHLNRILKDYYDITFKEKLLITRMESAKTLLLDSDESITEIGYLVGYSNTKYFSSQFKIFTGISPATYRTKYKDQVKNNPHTV